MFAKDELSHCIKCELHSRLGGFREGKAAGPLVLISVKEIKAFPQLLNIMY